MFQHSNDLIECSKCEGKILEKAWQIHRIMCDRKQKSNRLSRVKRSSKKQQQMIPCEQCGENISFEVYAFHEQQCLGGQLMACKYCSLKFPPFLMEEHNAVCEQKNKGEEQGGEGSEFEGHEDYEDDGEYEEQEQPHENLSMLISTLAIGEEKEKQQGLTKRQVDSLPLVTVIKVEDCSICCTGMKRMDRNVRLNCQHVFHKVCVAPWLLQNPLCPLCRAHALKK